MCLMNAHFSREKGSSSKPAGYIRDADGNALDGSRIAGLGAVSRCVDETSSSMETNGLDYILQATIGSKVLLQRHSTGTG